MGTCASLECSISSPSSVGVRSDIVKMLSMGEEAVPAVTLTKDSGKESRPLKTEVLILWEMEGGIRISIAAVGRF